MTVAASCFADDFFQQRKKLFRVNKKMNGAQNEAIPEENVQEDKTLNIRPDQSKAE